MNMTVLGAGLMSGACSSSKSSTPQEATTAVATLTTVNEEFATQAQAQSTSRALRLTGPYSFSCDDGGTVSVMVVSTDSFQFTYTNCDQDGTTINSPAPVTPVDFSFTVTGSTVTTTYSGGPVTVANSSGSNQLSFSAGTTISVTDNGSGSLTITSTGTITDNGSTVSISGTFGTGATGPNTTAANCGTTNLVLGNPDPGTGPTGPTGPYGPTFDFTTCGSASVIPAANLEDPSAVGNLYLDMTFQLNSDSSSTDTTVSGFLSQVGLAVYFNLADSACVAQFKTGATIDLAPPASGSICVDVVGGESSLESGYDITAACTVSGFGQPFTTTYTGNTDPNSTRLANCQTTSTAGTITLVNWSTTVGDQISVQFNSGATLSATNFSLVTIPESISGTASAIIAAPLTL